MKESKENLKERINELETELRKEKQRNAFSNSILESGNLIIWAVDREFNLVSFNQNYFQYFLPSNESDKIFFEKKGFLKSAKPDTFWRKQYKKVLEGKIVNIEVLINTDNGKEWKEVFLNPVYDNNVNIIAISGVANDITEKTESRIKLIRSEEKFRNIFESFQDLYFRTNFKGNITMLSPSVREIMGYAEKQLVGKNATNYYIYNIKIKSLLRDLIKYGSVRNFETGIIHKSGKVIPCICNIRIISYKGKPQYIEGVARDITELKKTAEELQYSKELAERSLKVKERFLANMSHEIKTPLNGIVGMMHLIDEKDLNSANKKRFHSLKASADILMGVLNDLLDISKIEAGKMELKNTVVNTKNLFKKLKTLYKHQADKAGIKLSFDIDKSTPQNLLVDEIKLMQVYSNLISNAIKFTPKKGSINVRLEVKKEFDNGKIRLMGIVSDNGIGISSEDQQLLFKSFTQLDSSSKKTYKGTGLGLYISKKLAELMGGMIGVESNTPNGTTFWFTFETKEILPSVSTPGIAEQVKLPYKARLLVVDDNKVNLQIAAEILKKSGCEVITADSGKSAIKKATNDQFDLIFMDIQMPDMDGVESANKIKKGALNQYTPIIAMTAYSMKGDREKYLSSGMDDYIAKPIAPESLIYAVKKWIEAEPSAIVVNKNQSIVSQHKTLNLDVLHNLEKFGGREMVLECLEEFKEECESQISQLDSLMKKQKFDDILVILHTLKGNSGTLGVQKLAFWAEFMEDEMKKKNYHIFEANMKELSKLYSEFKSEIKQF